MKPALRIENLSKEYLLGLHLPGQYRTLRDSLMRTATASWRGVRHALARPSSNGHSPVQSASSLRGQQTLRALKDISFEVQPGEVVGIIGHNGAGKSTLLKILSRVTEPTTGRVQLRGRLGSLLEVGTGFHAELTGRENIFLNGAILGMARSEIIRKFDAIAAFADIDQFLDTPVKRYSSGMYVRLAFAVAAHLEPEILVVDEVLAVGDAAFQNKCLQRMQDAGREGRTILFVSHNLAAMQTLCRRGLVLERGRLALDCPMREAAAHYVRSIEATATADLSQRTDRHGAGKVRFTKVEIHSDGTGAPNQLIMGRPARFVFHLNPLSSEVTCIFDIVDSTGRIVARFNNALRSSEDTQTPDPEPVLLCAVEEMLLAPGRYRLHAMLFEANEMQDDVRAAAFFDVIAGPVRGREPPRARDGWVMCLPHHWQNLG